MQDREIILTQEQFEELHKNFGSSHFKLQGEVLKEFGEQKLSLYFKSIEFTTSVTNVIGIIAGFGFTAMGYVQSMFLFTFGEGLLLSALFHGIWWVQKIYTGEYNSINADTEKFRSFFNNRNEKYMELYNNWSANKSINEEKFKALNKMDMSAINLFKTENTPSPETYSKTTYFLGIGGSVTLLASFFIYSLLHLFFYFFY